MNPKTLFFVHYGATHKQGYITNKAMLMIPATSEKEAREIATEVLNTCSYFEFSITKVVGA